MEPSERWHPIAPASDEPGLQRPPSDRRKRRQAIAVACINCRIGKAKCDGTRPRCIRCRDNDTVCHYDVAEGVSRAERMKILKRDTMSSRLEELERIVNFLRSSSDLQASTVLARLRLGERVEEVAKSLQSTGASSTGTAPPSLLGQDSTGTTDSGVSQESTSTFDDSASNTMFRQGSTVSLILSTEKRPGSATHTSILSPIYAPPAKGKQAASRGDIDDKPFLSIIYDRDDYLLAISNSDEEIENDENIDRRDEMRFSMPSSSSSFDLSSVPLRSPLEPSRSQRASPRRQSTIRSIYATHLMSRQSIVDSVTVHANLNLRNLFGNMPFSSSIRTNNYPPDNQRTQIKNLFLPTWSMMPVNTRLDPGSLMHAIPTVIEEATKLISQGTPVEHIIESHPNIAALFDEDEFNRSGILSKWSASMVHSAFLEGNTFTSFAYMYVSWYLIRWMISPSPETYKAIPEWLRPTPNQLFMPHIRIVDFVAWPAFRELTVQIPTMQERMEWLLDMAKTVQCDWSFSEEEALWRDEETGLLDLCVVAKETLRDLTNWSVAPSFRGYVSNADSYVRIRTDEY